MDENKNINVVGSNDITPIPTETPVSSYSVTPTSTPTSTATFIPTDLAPTGTPTSTLTSTPTGTPTSTPTPMVTIVTTETNIHLNNSVGFCFNVVSKTGNKLVSNDENRFVFIAYHDTDEYDIIKLSRGAKDNSCLLIQTILFF